MNGGPFAPFGNPRREARRPVKGMTILRLATLRYIEQESGATARSPAILDRTLLAAARWLAIHGFVGMVGRSFYPLDRALGPDTHEDVD